MTTDSVTRSTPSLTQAGTTTPGAADIYDRARARGASHAHAARILGRAWSEIIWRLWHDHDTYDPARHSARRRLIAAAA